MQILVKPMLAHRVKWSKVTYPCLVQPKLNGIRCIANNKHIISRDGHLWNKGVLPHIEEELAKLPDGVILDGELYCHGMSLQNINSRVAVKRIEPHEKVQEVNLHVFDCIADHHSTGRQALVELHLELLCYQNLIRVETHIKFTKDQVIQQHSRLKEAGYEGSMLRLLNEPYATHLTCGNKENRVYSVMKIKDFLDLDAKVVGVNEGEGRLKGTLGSFDLDYNGVRFSAGSGLSDIDRAQLWEMNCMGGTVKIRYEMLSDGGVPLKPTIIDTLI